MVFHFITKESNLIKDIKSNSAKFHFEEIKNNKNLLVRQKIRLYLKVVKQYDSKTTDDLFMEYIKEFLDKNQLMIEVL